MKLNLSAQTYQIGFTTRHLTELVRCHITGSRDVLVGWPGDRAPRRDPFGRAAYTYLDLLDQGPTGLRSGHLSTALFARRNTRRQFNAMPERLDE